MGGTVIDLQLSRLRRGKRPSYPLERLEDGRLIGRFYGCRLASAFQPILSAEDYRVAGYEALLRVYGSGATALSPWGLFSLAADESRRVQLDRLCRSLHLLNFPARHQAGRVFLNVRPRLLREAGAGQAPGFGPIIEHTGLPARRVVLEFTPEGLEDEALLGQALEHYRALGHEVALDGFGRHHCNLDRLWDWLPDIVKLDRRILAGASADARSRLHFARLIAVIHGLGAKVVVQGIERWEQLDIALQAGADLVQGYYVSMPLVRIPGAVAVAHAV